MIIKNIDKFFSEKLNLDSNILTVNLKTIGRYNLLGLLFNFESLDSLQICSNIEDSIKNRTLNETARLNLTNMKDKFNKSKNKSKANKCETIINRILNSHSSINTPSSQKISTPQMVPTTSSSPISSRHPSPILTTPSRSSPPMAPSCVPHPSRCINSQAANLQKGVVEAISIDSRKAGKEDLTLKKLILVNNNQNRIREIEKGITEADRRAQGDYKKMVYYPFNNTFYFIALKKEISNGMTTIKQVRLPAKEIETHLQGFKNSGSLDIGGNLRKQMEAMGIAIL